MKRLSVGVDVSEKTLDVAYWDQDEDESVLVGKFPNTSEGFQAIERKIEEPPQYLSSLRMGEAGEVLGISRACRGAQRRRLMDLGIVPGTVISMAMTSAGGDPKAYNIRGAMIALREDQADFVYIQSLKKVS